MGSFFNLIELVYLKHTFNLKLFTEYSLLESINLFQVVFKVYLNGRWAVQKCLTHKRLTLTRLFFYRGLVEPVLIESVGE